MYSFHIQCMTKNEINTQVLTEISETSSLRYRWLYLSEGDRAQYRNVCGASII